jgi:hypothetical protein
MPRNYHPDIDDLPYAIKRLRAGIEKEFDWATIGVLVWELRVVLDHLEGKEHEKQTAPEGPRAA